MEDVFVISIWFVIITIIIIITITTAIIISIIIIIKGSSDSHCQLGLGNTQLPVPLCHLTCYKQQLFECLFIIFSRCNSFQLSGSLQYGNYELSDSSQYCILQ